MMFKAIFHMKNIRKKLEKKTIFLLIDFLKVLFHL